MEKVLGIINLLDTPSLGQLTRDKSFGVTPFLDKYALLDFAISNLVNSNIDNIAILVGDHYDSVRSYMINHMANKKAEIRVVNGEDVDLSNEEYVVIVSPKFIMSIDYQEVIQEHIKSGVEITEIRSGESSLESYVISNSAFHRIKEILNDKQKKNSYEHKGLVIPILSLDQYVKESFKLLSVDRRKDLFKSNCSIYTTINDNAPTKYGDNAEVDNCIIGSGCFIRGTVKNSIVGQGVTIDESAYIEDCILLSNIYIGQRMSVKKSVLANNVAIYGVKRISGDEEDYLFVQEGVKL